MPVEIIGELVITSKNKAAKIGKRFLEILPQIKKMIINVIG
jgi:hypothetical protein